MSALTMASFSSRSARAALSAPDLVSRRARLCEFVMGRLSLIPASAECSIEFDDRGELLALERGEIEFTSEEVSLRVEDLQVAVEATLISVSREPRSVAEGRHELLLLRALLARLVTTGQRVRDVTECAIDRSLVVDDQLALDRLREPHRRASPTRIENRRGSAGRRAPRTGGSHQQCRQIAALDAEESGERDARKVFRPCRTNLRVRSHERLFRLPDIGTALEKC